MINSEEGRIAARRVDEPDVLASAVASPAGTTLIGIQVLRGLAALMVVFHHYVGTSVERGFAISGLERAAIGNAGVDIFFVISGFILEYTLGSRAVHAGDRSKFLLRRMARVLPLYWALTLVAYVIATFFPFIVNSTTTTRQLIYSMALLPDGAVGSYVLPLAWTLTFEFYFYLLFAAMMGLKPLHRLLGLAILFAPGLLVPEAAYAQNVVLGILLNPILFEFLAGVFLAQLIAGGVTVNRYSGAALVLAGSAMLLMGLNINVTESLHRLLVWGGPALLIVGGVVLARTPKTVGKPSLALRFGAWIGDRSYSLYLSHFFAISIFSKIYYHYLINHAVPPWLSGLGLFAVCILAAHVCYVLIERPARIRLASYFSRRKRQPQAA